MLLLSFKGPASDFRKKAFSACGIVHSLEGFYTVAPQHFHPKEEHRGSGKQLKLGKAFLQSQPAGFRCRTLMAPTHDDGHLLGFQNVRCTPLP